MFGFAIAEKERCYLEKELKQWELLAEGREGHAHSRQNSPGDRLNLLARGPGVPFTGVLK